MCFFDIYYQYLSEKPGVKKYKVDFHQFLEKWSSNDREGEVVKNTMNNIIYFKKKEQTPSMKSFDFYPFVGRRWRIGPHSQ